MVDGLSTAVSTGGGVFLRDAGEVMSKPASMFSSFADTVADTVGGNADIIARASQGASSVVLQAPVAADLLVGNEASGNIKDASGFVSGAVAAGQSVGSWRDFGGNVGHLGDSLAHFARALG